MSNQQHLYLGIAHLFQYLGTTNDIVPPSALHSISNVTSFIQTKLIDECTLSQPPSSPKVCTHSVTTSSSSSPDCYCYKSRCTDIPPPVVRTLSLSSSINPSSKNSELSPASSLTPSCTCMSKDRKSSVDSDLGVRHLTRSDLENSTNACCVELLNDSRVAPNVDPQNVSKGVLSSISSVDRRKRKIRKNSSTNLLNTTGTFFCC